MPLRFYKVSIDFTEFVRPEPKNFTYEIVVQAASESGAAEKTIAQFKDLERESGVGWQRRIDNVTVTVCEPPAIDGTDVVARDRERGPGVRVEKERDVVSEFIDVLASTSDLAYLRVPDELPSDEVAGYLLMVASIDEQADAGRVHDLFRALWDDWGNRVFKLDEVDRGELTAKLEELTAQYKPGRWIGLKNVTTCLITASRYFQSHDGRLIDRASQFQTAEEMVNDIADHVFRMGRDRCGARKKVWMYMRWMVRPAPDRELFKNFNASELSIPLDGNVARALMLISEQWDHPHLQSLKLSSDKLVPDAKNAQIATRFARDLFPDDPIRVDYPLFLLGRSRTGQSAKDSCRSKLESCRLGEMLDCKCEARSTAETRLHAHLARPVQPESQPRGLCPFCPPPANKVFHEGTLIRAFWDGFPVSEGHALLAPRRHIGSWFEATNDEQTEILAAIEMVRAEVERRHSPDGYNIGINVGEAAGQTVDHLHVHVIPRYRGDVVDPRGGVRHVIAEKAKYWGD